MILTIELKDVNLPKPSLVRLKFATVDKMIIVKTIGEIKDAERAEIETIPLSFFKS